MILNLPWKLDWFCYWMSLVIPQWTRTMYILRYLNQLRILRKIIHNEWNLNHNTILPEDIDVIPWNKKIFQKKQSSPQIKDTNHNQCNPRNPLNPWFKNIKKACKTFVLHALIFLTFAWRRKRDSNPRTYYSRQFSRLLQSTALPFLRCEDNIISSISSTF